MEEIEEYIQEVGHKIELFDMSFICRPCELLYEEDIRTIKPRVIKKLNTTTIQNMANQNYLTILCGQSNLYGTDIYIVHPTQENYQDILYTSTISS